MNEITKTDGQMPEIMAPVTPMAMLSMAVSRGATIEILEKLMALQERWETNQARKAFDQAISAAKAEIPVIIKNKQVGFESKKPGASKTDYWHEDLGEIARTIDPILGRYGLSYRWRTTSTPNEPVTVTCIISHSQGHSEENMLCAGRDDTGNKNSIQAIGSAITYLQRYTLKSALGLAASKDDDAKGAGPATITDEQVQDLTLAITETKSDIVKFLDFFKINALSELPATKFEQATNLLKAKSARP